MSVKSIDEKILARKMILNSLRIEESLVNILKAEVKILKKKSIIDLENIELQKLNRIIRYTLYVITILDERIQRGFDMLK